MKKVTDMIIREHDPAGDTLRRIRDYIFGGVAGILIMGIIGLFRGEFWITKFTREQGRIKAEIIRLDRKQVDALARSLKAYQAEIEKSARKLLFEAAEADSNQRRFQ